MSVSAADIRQHRRGHEVRPLFVGPAWVVDDVSVPVAHVRLAAAEAFVGFEVTVQFIAGFAFELFFVLHVRGLQVAGERVGILAHMGVAMNCSH